MIGDKSNNIFWNMIKAQKENKNKNKLNSTNLAPKRKRSVFLSKQKQLGDIDDPMKIIEKYPTYKKICLLQGLLKEMKSIKERFEDNKKDMLEKISHNCYNYYKSKIGMKEIYDYCKSFNPEIHNNYILLENTKEKLSTDYDIIYNILFLLRDNNDIMLNIIINCPTNSYEKLSEFLVNFFYENTINSNFNEEELMVIIYLILEDLIINKLPKTFSLTSNKTDSYINDSILYYIFKSITRKADVRNFTCTILSDDLLKLEGLNESLTINTKQIEKSINKDKSNQIQNEMINNRRGGIKDKIQRNLSYVGDSSLISKKNFGKKILPKFTVLEEPIHKNNSLYSIEEDEENDYCQNSLEIENKINLENIKLNNFFIDNDVTLEYLNEKLTEYENKSKQDSITNAMRDFLDLQINQISLDNCDIFSNSTKNNEIKKYMAMHNNESSDKLVNNILNNYKKLTNFIDEILKKLKDNITSLPYILKSISFIMEVLFLKKYSQKKVKNIDYHKLMFLSNYLIGNIILPLISNPDYNGIITTDVISKITRENLEIISKIITKMLSGKLFSNKKESEYTIFNKYIIDTLPKIFDIIICVILQKNFKLSKKIQKLINSINTIGNSNRNINYEYFTENQDNIQQQSICFSWLDLIILIDLFKLYNDIYTNEKYKKYISDFEKFKNLREICVENYNANLNKKEIQFFLFEKIKYNTDFQRKINNILQDNIFALMPNKDKENNEITLFKNCLVDVLSYTNILHKESFNYFVQKNYENIIQDNDIILLLVNEHINKKYKQTQFEGDRGKVHFQKNSNSDKNLVKIENIKDNLIGLEGNEDEDADFKEIIFPQIIESVKYELGNNLDDDKAKRIVFCSSYLQIHMDDLPQKYKKNNYCLLLMEIIQKAESIITEINISILNQFYLKVKAGEKLNMIITSNYLQIKKLEKCICIEYLYEKLDLPCKLNVKKDGMGIIHNIKYQPVDKNKSYVHSIQSFIDIFPNFRKYTKDVDDIIDLEEKVELDIVLNSYFKDLKPLIKNQNIIKRFSPEELEKIIFDLENYILFKLYDKLFPKESIKADIKFYKKCCRLDFVKPENLIKDKKMINEKLWKTSMDLINEMDYKLTPQDKVKNFGKAFSILQNSITFCSGKNELGIDDTISSLIYVMLKSKPKNIFSNSKYCQLFLDPELSKKEYGILLSQIEMIKNIINDMKYSDLIGITEEQFGKDEE